MSHDAGPLPRRVHLALLALSVAGLLANPVGGQTYRIVDNEEPPPRVEPRDSFDEASCVFVGRVLRIEIDEPLVEAEALWALGILSRSLVAELEVLRAWKGARVGEVVRIWTPYPEGGINFTPDAEYLVYAGPRKLPFPCPDLGEPLEPSAELWTSGDDRTRPSQGAETEFARLDGFVDGSFDEVLKDLVLKMPAATGQGSQ